MELYVGVDVSKNKLDIYINDVKNGDSCFENSKAGIKKLIQLLKTLESQKNVIKLIICEATGGYENFYQPRFKHLGYRSMLLMLTK